jgi:hypothetical protein
MLLAPVASDDDGAAMAAVEVVPLVPAVNCTDCIVMPLVWSTKDTGPVGAVVPLAAVTVAVRVVVWPTLMLVGLAVNVEVVATVPVVPVTVTVTLFVETAAW